MLPNQLDFPQQEYYAKSEKGLWAKTTRDDDRITVWWQPRYVMDGNVMKVVDANGQVCAEYERGSIKYNKPWQEAGTVVFTDEFLGAVPVDDFDWFVYGVMRHMARLITKGWGKEPSDIVELFNNVWNREFVMPTQYKLVGPQRPPFVGLDGLIIQMDDPGDDNVVSTGSVVTGFQESFQFEIDADEIIVALLISTIPV